MAQISHIFRTPKFFNQPIKIKKIWFSGTKKSENRKSRWIILIAFHYSEIKIYSSVRKEWNLYLWISIETLHVLAWYSKTTKYHKSKNHKLWSKEKFLRILSGFFLLIPIPPCFNSIMHMWNNKRRNVSTHAQMNFCQLETGLLLQGGVGLNFS